MSGRQHLCFFKHWVPEDLEGQQEGRFKEITLTQDHLFEEDIPLQGAFDGLVKEYTNQETAHHLLNLKPIFYKQHLEEKCTA